MLVQKFGGTSVGSPEQIKAVANLISDGIPKIVVLSAVSGTTNSLEEISAAMYKNDRELANKLITRLEDKYNSLVLELFEPGEYLEKSNELIKYHFDYMRAFTLDMFTMYEERAILAQGELLSTALMDFYLKSTHRESVLLPALNYMRVDKSHEPDYYYIKENLKRELTSYPGVALFITQGYICRDAYGEVDNLQRGGSDYSASLIGQAIGAEEIQIWTDIDGFHNNDPRFVENTKCIDRLSFEEAAELAYFGAKILHPASVTPAQESNIPVRLKNTMKPQDPGTLITEDSSGGGIKAIASKDGITAIKIKSGRMLLAYGFLRKVFEIFETYKTSIDMITTSEVAVSVTIDDDKYLDDIVKDLSKYGVVETDYKQSIICIVGDLIAEEKGYAMKIFEALSQVPIRMISYGGSRHNISLLVSTDDKVKALHDLSNNLFGEKC